MALLTGSLHPCEAFLQYNYLLFIHSSSHPRVRPPMNPLTHHCGPRHSTNFRLRMGRVHNTLLHESVGRDLAQPVVSPVNWTPVFTKRHTQ